MPSQSVSPAWLAQFSPLRKPVLPQIPPVTYVSDADACGGTDIAVFFTEFCHGEDSGFTLLYDTDLEGPAQDNWGTFPFRDSDFSGPEADLEQVTSATMNDSDAGTGEPLFGFPSGQYEWVSKPVSGGADACHGTEANGTFPFADTESCTGTEGHVVGIYSFQPPFRFTGGGYELRPERRAADTDYGRAQEHGELLLHVTAHVIEALAVTAEAR